MVIHKHNFIDPRDSSTECGKHVDENEEKTPEAVQHGSTPVHHVPGRVLMDAATTSLITTSVHSRPIPVDKCILALESPEDPKWLFSEPTRLSQKNRYIGCELCGLNNSLVDINLMNIYIYILYFLRLPTRYLSVKSPFRFDFFGGLFNIKLLIFLVFRNIKLHFFFYFSSSSNAPLPVH